jgi:hypothetical protein
MNGAVRVVCCLSKICDKTTLVARTNRISQPTHSDVNGILNMLQLCSQNIPNNFF